MHNLLYFCTNYLYFARIPYIRNMKINVGIVDDHKLFSDGISNLIQGRTVGDGHSQYDITLRAFDGEELLNQLAAGNVPAIILLDIQMPNINGLDALRVIKADYSDVKVIMCTMSSHEDHIIGALQLDVDGYLLKDASIKELMHALDTVQTGGKYFVEEVAHTLLKFSVKHQALFESDLFTVREKLVLQFCCDELSSKEIAERLNISLRTVEGQIYSLMEKCQVKSRVGLAKYAIKNNFYKI